MVYKLNGPTLFELVLDTIISNSITYYSISTPIDDESKLTLSKSNLYIMLIQIVLRDVNYIIYNKKQVTIKTHCTDIQ